MKTTKLAIISLAIAFLVSLAFVWITLSQVDEALTMYNNLLEDYAQLKDEYFHDLDEASENGYEAGFKIGWSEAMDTKFDGIHDITINDNGEIHFQDELGEEYIWNIDGSVG